MDLFIEDMGLFQFGKRIKHRQFEYIPRHYDPDKEELQRRLSRYNRNAEDVDLSKERIRGGLRRKYRVSNEYSQTIRNRSNKILLFTIAGLLLVTFYFINEYLPRIIASFE